MVGMDDRITPMYRNKLRWEAHSLRFRCRKGWQLLQSDPAIMLVIRTIEDARQQRDFDLWAYVVLPDHVHVVIWPRKDVDSMAMIAEAIRDPVTQAALNAGIISREPFWEMGEPYDQPLGSVREIHTAMMLLHENPVKRKLVERPEAYKYSSAAFWMGSDDVPIKMDVTVPRLQDEKL
jgi:putative transposase